MGSSSPCRRRARKSDWLSVRPVCSSPAIQLIVSALSSVWLGKVTENREILSSKRGGLIPALRSASSIARIPEPRFSHTVRVSPGTGTSSSSRIRVALRAEEISPRSTASTLTPELARQHVHNHANEQAGLANAFQR